MTSVHRSLWAHTLSKKNTKPAAEQVANFGDTAPNKSTTLFSGRHAISWQINCLRVATCGVTQRDEKKDMTTKLSSHTFYVVSGGSENLNETWCGTLDSASNSNPSLYPAHMTWPGVCGGDFEATESLDGNSPSNRIQL